jgi:P-type E1-E2 ATPase
MVEVEIPGLGTLKLEHAVFDVNGTLAVDGKLIDGVLDRLAALRKRLQVHLITADTHGQQAEIDRALSLQAQRMAAGGERRQKADLVYRLGASSVVAIGNGSNDAGMLKAAVLSIAVIGREGASAEALASADVVVVGILDAIDLLLIPKRLIATLRK